MCNNWVIISNSELNSPTGNLEFISNYVSSSGNGQRLAQVVEGVTRYHPCFVVLGTGAAVEKTTHWLSWKGEGRSKLYAQAQKWSLCPSYVVIVELPESL